MSSQKTIFCSFVKIVAPMEGKILESKQNQFPVPQASWSIIPERREREGDLLKNYKSANGVKFKRQTILIWLFLPDLTASEIIFK